MHRIITIYHIINVFIYKLSIFSIKMPMKLNLHENIIYSRSYMCLLISKYLFISSKFAYKKAISYVIATHL